MKIRLFTLFILLPPIFLGILFFSCSGSPPDLSEYQGVDYIANYRFSSAVLGWQLPDNIIAPNGHYYMGFNSNESGAADIPPRTNLTGLPSDAVADDIYRLEIFNLVNDGGFESGTAHNWNKNNALITLDGYNLNSNRVHYDESGNHSLYYQFVSPNDYVWYDLNSVKDLFIADSKYIIRLNFAISIKYFETEFIFSVLNNKNNPVARWKPKAKVKWGEGYTQFPKDSELNSEIPAQPANNTFTVLWTQDSQEGYIDDFRIIRSDINYNLKFTVPYSEEGRPNLYSGKYRFSAYFMAESNTDISPNADRFPSPCVSLGIKKTGSAGAVKSFDSSSFTNTGWTKLTIEESIQINEGDVIELTISPADNTGGINTLDIGSVLIAFPEFYYISD